MCCWTVLSFCGTVRACRWERERSLLFSSLMLLICLNFTLLLSLALASTLLFDANVLWYSSTHRTMPFWLLVQRGSIVSQPTGWTLRFPVSAWSILPLRLPACPPLISNHQQLLQCCYTVDLLLKFIKLQGVHTFKIIVFVIQCLFYRLM